MAGKLQISLEKKTEQHLEVTIKNKKPVVLTDLTASLHAIGEQYHAFVLNDAPADQQISTRLLVKDVRSGSIIFDLVANALPIVPMLWDGGSLAEWCKVAKEMLAAWVDTKKKPPRAISKTDLNQWDSILEPIAKDQGSQMNITARNGNVTVNQIIINHTDANVAQNTIHRQLEELDEPIDATYRKKAMTWYQAKFDNTSKTGNKVKIESVTHKPLKVVFDNDKIKEEMFSQGSEFGVPWQKLAYIVDVTIETINEVPRVAVITKYYPKETFNPED